MTSNALRVVPVVDGITDTTCICVEEEKILVGKSNGTIAYYKIISGQTLSIPTVEPVATIDTLTRRPITSISSLGSVVVAVSNESAFSFSLSGTATPNVLWKSGVVGIALHITSTPVSFPNIAVVVSGGLKRKILTFTSKSGTGSYSQDPQEISTGSDIVTSLVWVGNWLIGASSRSYLSVNMSTDRTVHDIFPVDACACICLLKATNEVLLVGHDGLGIFMNIQSDGLSPAPRNTISISHPDVCMSVVGGSYIASVSSLDGIVEVFSLTSNDTKMIQTINLPGGSGMITATSTSGTTSAGLPVLAGSVLYLLITIPFETQLKKLIESKKLEEALEMVNYQYPPGPERDRALKSFHRQVAWKLFDAKEFSVAFVHFSLAATREDVERLLGTSNCERQPMACFLRGFRGSSECRENSDLIKKIDYVLIELLSDSADDLLDFLRNGSCSLSVEEARTVLNSNSPIGLAVMLEQHGSHAEAIQVALEAASKIPVDDFVGLANRNVETISPRSISKIIEKLIELEAPNDRIVDLIVRSRNPLVHLALTAVNRDVRRAALENLSETSGEALESLVSQLIEDGDSDSLENIVRIHRLKSVGENVILKDSKFDFVRMMILGHQGKHREAFVQFPHLGERYIESITSETPMSRLVFLSCAVLFESNDHKRSIDLLLKNEAVLLNELKGSEIVEVIPSDVILTVPLLNFLDRLNAKCQNASRKAVVAEHKASYNFLSTFNDWSEMRQTNPVVVSDETSCSICSCPLLGKQKTVAILPNGSSVHPGCLDPTNKSTASQA